MSDTLSRRDIMSQGFGIIPKKVMRDRTLSVEAKAIYAYLASFAGSEHIAFPSVSLMCDELSMSRDRFYKYRKQLVESGYVEILNCKNDEGKFSKNVYRLLDGEYTDSPYTENSYTDFPNTGNQDTNNNSSTSNSFISNNPKKSSGAKAPKRFKPPTFDEVKAYYDEKHMTFDLNYFWQFFTEGNWKDSRGNQVKNWKQKMITWENQQKRRNPQQNQKQWCTKEVKVPAAWRR